MNKHSPTRRPGLDPGSRILRILHWAPNQVRGGGPFSDWLRYVFLICFLVSCLNCGSIENNGNSDDTITIEPTLVSIQENIFTPKCATCHIADSGGLDLTSEEASFAGLVGVASIQTQCGDNFDEDCGLRVTAGDPDSSYLMDKLVGDPISFGTDPMPRNAAPLSDEELAAIREWIQNGAQE